MMNELTYRRITLLIAVATLLVSVIQLFGQ
jgi:hypothetical protein